MLADVGWASTPRLALVRAGALDPAETGGEAEVVSFEPSFSEFSTLATLEGHSAVVSHVAWSPDGKRIASGGGDRAVRLYNGQDYREERDNIGVFLEAALEQEPGGEVKAGVLYKAYTDWCDVNALRPASQRSFGDSLGERGLKKKRGNYVVYLDVKLLPTASKYDPANTPPRTPSDDPGWRTETI